MKCIPMKFWGDEWEAASFVMLMLEVFEAKMESGDEASNGANDLITPSFTFKSSFTA